ncbi:flagellar basal-body MS-ring/collar protein FliF [Calidifontibacillus oryziterrae]|uniref:flagellar basal-body MS-ring/collar protein FliF n=1 Tax=Calidifontibacillus oryziterrae TaxID=1191699 RepID=UPI0003156483|nr:flagellar basal-body MS-ring/collar protein FliF [Calidifontibacillus oryziterrae]
MNEKLLNFKTKFIDFWNARTKTQQGVIIGSIVSIIALLILVSTIAAKPNLVPLFHNVSPQEIGQIKATLDERGIQSEITPGGTGILVPEELVDTLLVELSAEGIPDSGETYFSSFGESGFGITQEEFEMRKNAAVQSELKRLIKKFEGVQDAEVMISLPQQSVFIGEEQGTASASIVIHQKPGYKFKDEQIEGLYHLVSKSVANLPIENIVITNQYFEHIDKKNLFASNSDTSRIQFADQYQIQKQIERDIQLQVQQMLGLMMGREKVIVTVTADIDTSQVNTRSDIVQPIDEENMKGIAISAEKISESFVGSGTGPGGVVGTGETDIPNQYVEQTGENGEYENIEERINYDVTRIMETVEGSPYKVEDLGIQVAIDSTDMDEQTMQALTPEIQNMLNGIIKTTVSNKDANLDGRVNVTWQQFNGIVPLPEPTFMDFLMNNPSLVLVGLLLLLIIIVAIVLLVRRKKKGNVDNEIQEMAKTPSFDIPDVNEEHETEAVARRKQLEKMAKEKPDEFAKLLRSWLAED